jgi:hypothetical protein
MNMKKTPTLNQPFDQLTEKQLRKGIEEKFGSIARFAELSGINKWIIYKAFNGKRDQSSQAKRLEIYMSARETKNATIGGVELSREKKNEIRMAILSHRDAMKNGRQSMKNFCEKHDVNASWLSKVLSTQSHGKQLTNGREFERIIKLLKISL